MKKTKDKFSKDGYKITSKDRNNPKNVIPSGRITMQDVPHPVYGIDNQGNRMMMYPGMEYQFPGDIVTEYPMKQVGGEIAMNNNSYNTDPIINNVNQNTHYLYPRNNEGNPNITDPNISGYRSPMNGSDQPQQHQAGTTLFPGKYGDLNYFSEMENRLRVQMEQNRLEEPNYVDAQGNLIPGSINPRDLQKRGSVDKRESIQMSRQINKTIRQNDLPYSKVQRDAFVYEGSNEIPSFKEGGEQDNAVQLKENIFYDKRKSDFLEWIKNKASVNSPQIDSSNSFMQSGGNINSGNLGIGRVYSSPYDQPMSPDIYNDPEFSYRNSRINNVDYGRQQANIDYSTSGVKTVPIPIPGMITDMGNGDINNQGGVFDNQNYFNQQVQNPYQQTPLTIDDRGSNPVQSTEKIFLDEGTATFDRNKPLERQLKKQQRQDRRNSISGETKANVLLSGLDYVNNLAGRNEQRNREEELNQFYATENIFGSNQGYRGDYLTNTQGANFRPNNFTFGNFGKNYQMGGGVPSYADYNTDEEYEMTDEELAEFIANGGEVDYID